MTRLKLLALFPVLVLIVALHPEERVAAWLRDWWRCFAGNRMEVGK